MTAIGGHAAHIAAPMTMPTTAAQGAASAHGAHLEPTAPRSGDPRFVAGSTGEFGQSELIRQKNGPAYGGREVAKEQNDNDREQNDFGVTDANFTRTLGVIADPDTGAPMSYAQTIQAYNAAGAIENLAPAVYAKLVENQNAGRGTVLGGALAILGITGTDGANGASLTGIDAATQGQLQTMQLGPLGSLREYVLDTKDFKGREWNRAHHSGSAWKGMTDLVQKGYGWDTAALATGDSMTSWSGRVLGSNNQDGSETGFAADELAGLKYTVLMEQATGKPALESILGAHAATHLPEDQLTDPKINKLIGLPEGFRPQTTEEISMVAGRLRQWASSSQVQVDQGEFQQFVDAGAKTPEGQQLAGSGLLSTVQFEAEEAEGGGGGNDGPSAAEQDAATEATGLGQGAAATAMGGGDIAPVGLAGSPTIDTRPALDQLGVGGPFPVLDPDTGKLNKALQDQLMTAFVDMLQQVNDSTFLGEAEEKDAFADGARKGVQMLKEAIARDPEGVTSLKAEARTAIEDGELTDAERTSLSQKLGDAGLEELANSVKDGKLGVEELDIASATFDEQIDGAASAQLEKDLTAALEDGTLDDTERSSFEGRVGAGAMAKLDETIADGEATGEELRGIADAVQQDGAATTTDEAATDEAATGEATAGAEATAPADADTAEATAEPGSADATDSPEIDTEAPAATEDAAA